MIHFAYIGDNGIRDVLLDEVGEGQMILSLAKPDDRKRTKRAPIRAPFGNGYRVNANMATDPISHI